MAPRDGPRRTPAGIADGSNAAQGALGQRRDGRARSPTARGGLPHRLPDNPAPQPVAHVPARSRRLPRYWAGPDRPIAVRQLVSYGPRYTRAEGAPRSQPAALIEEQAQHRPRRTRWPDSLIALPGACCAPGVGRRPAIHRQRHARHRPPTRAAVRRPPRRPGPAHRGGAAVCPHRCVPTSGRPRHPTKRTTGSSEQALLMAVRHQHEDPRRDVPSAHPVFHVKPRPPHTRFGGTTESAMGWPVSTRQTRPQPTTTTSASDLL